MKLGKAAWKLAKAAKRIPAWRRGEDELFDNDRPEYGVCKACNTTIRWYSQSVGWVHVDRKDWDHRAEPLTEQDRRQAYEESIRGRFRPARPLIDRNTEA